jgi:hypothetical protein
MGAAVIALMIAVYAPDLISAIREVAAALRGDPPDSDEGED